MQTEIEELTREYNQACAKAVRDVIHDLANKWGTEVVDTLNEASYGVCVELFEPDLSIHAYVGVAGFLGFTRFEDESINHDVQEAFGTMNFQVVLNAMIHYGMETTTETLHFRVY